MKLIHLSDLHLGKRVNEFSMIEDQKYILDEILRIIDKEEPDGILLAGDLYDRPVPSAEAVQLFDSFLTRLAKRKLPVYAIGGNHDSAERIAFGAHIMSSSGICMSPVYDGKTAKYCLMDSYGEVWIHLLPFIRPSVVRHALSGEESAEEIRTYQEAVQAAVEHMEIEKDKRNVLVAHQFAVGAVSCDSEEITVGGIDQIEVSVFSDFDYVALGHIHSPQNVGSPKIRYCGTPLKYSFSESGQQKSVTVVELLEKGQVDLIVCNFPNSRLGNHMQIRVLKEFQDIFIGNPEYFPLNDMPRELNTLLEYPILMLSGKSTTSEYLHQAFASQGLNLLPEVELNSNDLLMDLARIGLGIACIPNYMLSPDDSLKPISLISGLSPRQLVLVYHDGQPLSQAAERFLEIL